MLVVGVVVEVGVVGELVGAGSGDSVCLRVRFWRSWVSTGSGTAVADGAGAACAARLGGVGTELAGAELAGAEDAGSRVGWATGVAVERSEVPEAIEPRARVALGAGVTTTAARSSAVGVPVEALPGRPTRGSEARVWTGDPESGQ